MQSWIKKQPLIEKDYEKPLKNQVKAIEEFIDKSWGNGGKVKSFKKGLIPMIAYFIAHEAHHRGHAMLTMKQSGVKIPEILKWGLWDWDN